MDFNKLYNKLYKKFSAGKSKTRGRKSNNTFTTKSGKSITVNRSLTDKLRAKKDAAARRRARRLAGMPKSRTKRILYMMQPKRMYNYWFSRDGAIMALKLTGIGIIGGFLVLIGLFAYFRKDLPNLRDISGMNIGGSIRYFDRTGKKLLWEDFDAVKRIPIEGEEINEFMKDATIAVEDKDFFRHSGFDLRGIIRAAWSNATGGGTTQGASTLSQQLVRLTQASVGNEQTYTRKLKEVILSVELERTFSKEEILDGYLNTAPYGNVQYGVESASRDYFQKSADKLTLDEAAFLAAIPQSPSFYSPYGPIYDPEALVGRQHYILDLMAQQNMITADQREKAKKVATLKKVKQPKQKFAGIKAPYFVLAAKEELGEKFGAETVQRGGWKVRTTVDLKLQETAEKAVADGMYQVNAQGGDVAAFVAEEVDTGQVVALVGGPDFNNEQYGQNNYAKSYRLPPGSSFKPYDYAALIEKKNNIGAGSVLYDERGPLPGYPCTTYSTGDDGNCLRNYDNRYPGPVTLRYALGGSRNIPAVKAMLTVGVDKTIEVANSLGLTSGYKCYVDDELTEEGPCYGSSAIGDGAYLKLDEHVHAFSSLSRMGKVIPQSYILKIEDSAGKVVDEWKKESGEQVIRKDTAYIISDILSDPSASYFTGSSFHRFGGNKGTWKFAMKTGTTNDSKDGWMMGYSKKYAAGVWVGSHDRSVEMSGFMESMTRPIFLDFMQEVHRDKEPKEWAKPSGVKTLAAYIVRQHIGLGSIEPSPSEDLYPRWYKKGNINSEQQDIDIVSNKLATDCTPSRARRTVTGGSASSFSADRFVDGGAGSANTSAKDDVHKCGDNKPGVSLSINKAGGKKYQLVARVSQGTHPISSDRFPGYVEFYVNGNLVKKLDIGGPGTYSYTYNANSGGTYQAKAVVVDSVLYDGSSSGSFTVAGGGGSNSDSLEITSATFDGGNTSFSWSGGSGFVTIYKEDDDSPICSSGGNSCSSSTDYSGEDVYAEDNEGNRSSTVEVD